MATFDQLAADQRAIIELVLRQGKSYEEIGDALDSPPARVRELARDALAELAPFTAEFVDPQWRGQLADYVLGQQTGPEAQATRGHLRRSEPARIWAYSLVDALDDFYEDADRPDIPVGEAGAKPKATAAKAEAPAAAAAAATGPRTRSGSGGGGLSPAAQSALQRRRIGIGVVGLAVLALLIVGAIAIFGGGDDNDKKASAAAPTSGSNSGATGAQGQGEVVAQAVLSPVKGVKGSGAALVYQSGNQAVAVVRAKVPASTGNNKYVLWLYNSEKQLQPLAADKSDKNGNFQGAAGLPANWQNYRFIDVTYQPTSGKNIGHGRSVLRGPLTAPQQSGGTGTGTGTSTTP